MFIPVPDRTRPSRPWATPALALTMTAGFIAVWAPSDAVTARLLNDWATLPANLSSALHMNYELRFEILAGLRGGVNDRELVADRYLDCFYVRSRCAIFDRRGPLAFP